MVWFVILDTKWNFGKKIGIRDINFPRQTKLCELTGSQTDEYSTYDMSITIRQGSPVSLSDPEYDDDVLRK